MIFAADPFFSPLPFVDASNAKVRNRLSFGVMCGKVLDYRAGFSYFNSCATMRRFYAAEK